MARSEFSRVKRENSETYQKQPKYQKKSLCLRPLCPTLKLLNSPPATPNLSSAKDVFSPFKRGQNYILCKIEDQVWRANTSVQAVVNITSERQRPASENAPPVRITAVSPCYPEMIAKFSHTLASMQITPATQPMISTQNIRKAVAKAQRRGNRIFSRV
jgi:hypothetical protein